MNILGFPINKKDDKTNKSIRETEKRDINESRNIETGTLPLVNNLISYGMKKVFSRDINVKRDEELEPKNVNDIKSEKEEDIYLKLNKWKEDRVLDAYENNNLSKELLNNNIKVTQGQKDVVPENNFNPIDYSRNTIKKNEGNYNNGNEFRVQNLELENSYSSSGSGKVISNWKTNKKIFSSNNKSEEEIKNIFALKNRNTYNKSLGYIYIDSNKIYSDNGNKDNLTFQIPFEFNPEIAEGGAQANYVSETLLNRIGQYQVYTGTNLSQLSITLKYTALAPDEIDKEMQNNMSKQFSTDSWQYYWTNNRIEEIEYKLRSLVFPDTTTGNYLVKPPMIEIHFNNGSGDGVDSVGDLFKYPIGINSSDEDSDKKYLSVTRSFTSDDSINRYKKYIVTNVQIDNLNEDSLSWPSLYGRVWRDGKSGAPINHIMTAKDVDEKAKRNGFLGNVRRTGFKATLQCIEVTENFLDIVPDFKAYYNAWNFKKDIANITSDYARATLNENLEATTDFLTASLNTAIYGIASLEESLGLKFEEAYLISLLYKNARTENKDLWKLNRSLDNDEKQIDYYFLNKVFLNNQGQTATIRDRNGNVNSKPLFEISAPVSYKNFYSNVENEGLEKDFMDNNIDDLDKKTIEKITKSAIVEEQDGEISIAKEVLFGENNIPTNEPSKSGDDSGSNTKAAEENSEETKRTLSVGYDTETVLSTLKDSTCKSAYKTKYSDIEASLIMKKMLYGKEILDNEASKYIIDESEYDIRKNDIDECYKKLYNNSFDKWPSWITDFYKDETVESADEDIKNADSNIKKSESNIEELTKNIEDEKANIAKQEEIIKDEKKSQSEKDAARNNIIDSENNIKKYEESISEEESKIESNYIIIKEAEETKKDIENKKASEEQIAKQKEEANNKILEDEKEIENQRNIIGNSEAKPDDIEAAAKKISELKEDIKYQKNIIISLEEKEKANNIADQRKQMFYTYFYYVHVNEKDSPNMKKDLDDLKNCLIGQTSEGLNIQIDLKKDMEMSKSYRKAQISVDDEKYSENNFEILKKYETYDKGSATITKFSYSGENIYTTSRYVESSSNSNANATIKDMMAPGSDPSNMVELLTNVKNAFKEIHENFKQEGLKSDIIESSIKKLENLKNDMEKTLFLDYRKNLSITYMDPEKSNKEEDEYCFSKIKDSKIKEIIGNIIEKLKIINKNIEAAKESFLKVYDTKNLLRNEYKSAFKNLIEWQSIGLINGGIQKTITEKRGNGFKYKFIEAAEKRLASVDDTEIIDISPIGDWKLSRSINYKGEKYLNFYNRDNKEDEIRRVAYDLNKDDMNKYLYKDEVTEDEKSYYHLYTMECYSSQKVFHLGITKNGDVDVYAMGQSNRVDNGSAFIMLCYIPSDILKKIDYRVKNNNSYIKGNLYDDYLLKEKKKHLGERSEDTKIIISNNILAFINVHIDNDSLSTFGRYGNFEKNLNAIKWDFYNSSHGNFLMDLDNSTTTIIYKKGNEDFIVKISDKKDEISGLRIGKKMTPIDAFNISDNILKELKLSIPDEYKLYGYSVIPDISEDPKEDYYWIPNSNWTNQKTNSKIYFEDSACSGVPRGVHTKKDWKINDKYIDDCFTYRNVVSGDVSRLSSYKYYFSKELDAKTGIENAFNIPNIAIKELVKEFPKENLSKEKQELKAYSDSIIYYDDIYTVYYVSSKTPNRYDLIKNISYKGKFGEKQESIKWDTNKKSVSEKMLFSAIVRDTEGEAYQLAYSDSEKKCYMYNSKDNNPYLILDFDPSSDENKNIPEDPDKLVEWMNKLVEKTNNFNDEIIKYFPQKAIANIKKMVANEFNEIIDLRKNYKKIDCTQPGDWGVYKPLTLLGEKIISCSDSLFNKKNVMPWNTSKSSENLELYKNSSEKDKPYNLLVIKNFKDGRVYQIGKNIYGKLVLFEGKYVVDLDSINFNKLNLPTTIINEIKSFLNFSDKDIEVTVGGPSKDEVDDTIKIKEYEISNMRKKPYRLSNVKDIVVSMVKELDKVKKTFNKLYESIKGMETDNLENGYKLVFQEISNIKFPDISELEIDPDNLSLEEAKELSEKVLSVRDAINLNLVNFRDRIKKVYNEDDGLSYEGLQKKFTKIVGRYEDDNESEPYIKGLKKLFDGYKDYSKSKDELRKSVFKKWDEVESRESAIVKNLTSSEDFKTDFQTTDNGEIPKAYNDMWMSNEKLSQMKVAGDNLNINMNRLS